MRGTIQLYDYNQRQRFWHLEFVNERLKASRLPMLKHVTDLPLYKENAHVFSYPGLTHWHPAQGQLPRTLSTRDVTRDARKCGRFKSQITLKKSIFPQ